MATYGSVEAQDVVLEVHRFSCMFNTVPAEAVTGLAELHLILPLAEAAMLSHFSPTLLVPQQQQHCTVSVESSKMGDRFQQALQ